MLKLRNHKQRCLYIEKNSAIFADSIVLSIWIERQGLYK